MSNFRESMIMTGQPEYEKHFWNAMRGDNAAYDKLDMGRMANIGTYLLPTAASKKCMAELEEGKHLQTDCHHQPRLWHGL